MLTKSQLKEARSILNSQAGSVKSKKKAKASRENGKLGGRPKKFLDWACTCGEVNPASEKHCMKCGKKNMGL